MKLKNVANKKVGNLKSRKSKKVGNQKNMGNHKKWKIRKSRKSEKV